MRKDEMHLIQADLLIKIIFLFLLFILFSCKSKNSEEKQEAHKLSSSEQNKIFFISSQEGLILREQPTKLSKKLDLIPFAEKITITDQTLGVEKIDGLEDIWVETSYRNKKGWVFRGYLSETNPYIGTYFSQNYQCDDYTRITIEESLTWSGNFYRGSCQGECGYAYIEGKWFTKGGKICFIVEKADIGIPVDHYTIGTTPCYWLNNNYLETNSENNGFVEHFRQYEVTHLRKK